MRFALFNWNGTLTSDIVDDCKKFNIEATPIPGGVDGFELYDVIGPGLELWAKYYDLEA